MKDIFVNGNLKEPSVWLIKNSMEGGVTDIHQTPFIGVHLMLIQNNQLLLQKRKGGFTDGIYTPVSGHVDKREGVIDALIREAKEEAGISLKKEDLKISVIAHLLDAPYKGGRADIINYFVFTDKYEGEIENKEPDKIKRLEFFDMEALPSKLMSHIFEVIKAYNRKENYIVIDYLDKK